MSERLRAYDGKTVDEFSQLVIDFGNRNTVDLRGNFTNEYLVLKTMQLSVPQCKSYEEPHTLSAVLALAASVTDLEGDFGPAIEYLVTTQPGMPVGIISSMMRSHDRPSFNSSEAIK